MTGDDWLPLLVVLTSLATGLVIFFLKEEQSRLRTILNMIGATVKLGLVGFMLWGVFHAHQYETRLPFLPDLDLVLRADALALIFVTLSAGLWLLTTIYAIGYLEESPNRSRFFGFFSLCVTSTMGIALAGNLLTFFVFYEMLTLATYPLVIHRGTAAALRAGNIYLFYTLSGGALLLAGIAWLTVLAGPVEFNQREALTNLADQHADTLRFIFVLLIAGLGVKAALVPLHGWLPVAMVAPAPVSALLHAVAVVKAGAFGIVRMVYDVFGIHLVADLGLLTPLAIVAAVTILYGSMRALAQDDLKRRLAFSTISQISYIVLGVALLSPLAIIGGVAHLVHQGIMKITMFFCAGNVAETLGIHSISEMNGVGRRMPWTMVAFSMAALGMIGVPPLAGFISKWYLGLGALEADQSWALIILTVSALLNAAYFLPILYRAWLTPPAVDAWSDKLPDTRFETKLSLLAPAVLMGLLTLAVGIFAGTLISPLEWAKLIAEREFPP
jgi:multicomponent Na+:H+ antiporter subunit D